MEKFSRRKPIKFTLFNRKSRAFARKRSTNKFKVKKDAKKNVETIFFVQISRAKKSKKRRRSSKNISECPRKKNSSLVSKMLSILFVERKKVRFVQSIRVLIGAQRFLDKVFFIFRWIISAFTRTCCVKTFRSLWKWPTSRFDRNKSFSRRICLIRKMFDV